MKRNKPRKEAEDRRKPRRRALRDIEDREWDEESKHLDDDLSELLEGDGIAEDMEDDWLP